MNSALSNALIRVRELEQQLAAAKAERDHWKANHETEVRRARILKERHDLPIERVQAYEQWGKDQQQLAAAQANELRLREALIRAIERMCFAEPWSAAQSDIEFANESLATPPGDMTALREVIALVLAEVEHRRWATKLAIDQLRSGEWTPEALK